MTVENKLRELYEKGYKRHQYLLELWKKTGYKSITLDKKLRNIDKLQPLFYKYFEVIANPRLNIKKTKEFLKRFPSYLLEEEKN